MGKLTKEQFAALSPEEKVHLAGVKDVTPKAPKLTKEEFLAKSPEEKHALAGVTPAAVEEGGIKDAILNTIGVVGGAIDAYGGGASTRKGINSLVQGKGVKQAVSDFVDQYGDSETAPSGQEIAKHMGLSEEAATGRALPISPAQAVGTAIDFFADPMAIATGVTKAFKFFKGGEELLKGVKEAGAAKIGKIATKSSSAATGLPEKVIHTYATKTDEVEALIKKYGPDGIPQAADDMRENLMKHIHETRREANAQITDALKAASDEPVIEVEKMLGELEKQKARVNTKLYPEVAAQFDDLLGRVKNHVGDRTALSVGEAQELKEFLQDRAKAAYNNGGQIFQNAKETARASKSAAAEVKTALDKLGPPELKSANAWLTQLHRLEERLNKNLITAGKSDTALIAAGGGTNARNMANLRKLEKLTGAPAMEKAEILAAADKFADPPLMTMDTTGKGMERLFKTRALVGAGGGALVDGPEGAVAGALLTSPALLKQVIKRGKQVGNIASKIPGKLPATELVRAMSVRDPQSVGREEAQQSLMSFNQGTVESRARSLMLGGASPVTMGVNYLANLPPEQLEHMASGADGSPTNLWTALGGASTYLNSGASHPERLEYAGGHLFGGIVRQYGAQQTKMILQQVGGISGIPTAKKVLDLNLPQEIKQALLRQLGEATLVANREGRPIPVPPELIDQTTRDIRYSPHMSLADKARNISQLNDTGEVLDFDRILGLEEEE